MKNLGLCGTTATPLPGPGRFSGSKSSDSSSSGISRSRRDGSSTRTCAVTSSIVPSVGTVGISTYNVSYPNPVVGLGGDVRRLTSNRHLRVITASTNFPHSTRT